MSTGDLWLLVIAAILVVLAGLFAAAEAALSGFSRARAGELAGEPRAGAERLVVVLDDAPPYLNTALFVRMLCEIAATVLVAVLITDYVRPVVLGAGRHRDGSHAGRVVRGGRRRAAHPRPAARRRRRAVVRVAAVGAHPDPRAVPQAADPDRQRDHPRPRFPRGPVLDRDRAAGARRHRRGVGGDRVRRAEDDPFGLRARRHHRARGHGAARRRGLHRGATRTCGRRSRCSSGPATRGCR